MFRGQMGVRTACVVSVLGVLAMAGSAFGAGEGARNGMVRPAHSGSRGGGNDRGGHHGGDHGGDRGYGNDRGWDRGGNTDVRINLDFGRPSYWGGGYRGYGYRYDYCPPPVVVYPRPCPPVVVIPAPYCPPPVIVRDDYYEYRRPVIIESPRVVERTVVIERPVERIIERPVVVERAQEVRVVPETGSYRDRELGDAYLRLADHDSAARVYRKYLSAWASDGTATRNFGLALVGRGDAQEGFRAVVSGYTLEPELFKRPLRVQDLGGPVGTQILIDQTARSADGINSADGWFTLAVVQSVAGQKDQALAALQRARAQGLPTNILDAATLEFSR